MVPPFGTIHMREAGQQCPASLAFVGRTLAVYPKNQPDNVPVVHNFTHPLTPTTGGDMSGFGYMVRRAGTLHFRTRIPADLKERLGRCEPRVSLGTARVSEARAKVLWLAGFVCQLINDPRAGLMANLSREAICELVSQEMARVLSDDRRKRVQDSASCKFSVALPVPGCTPLDLHVVTEPCQAQDRADELIQAKRWPQLAKPVMDILARHGVSISPWEPEFNEVCYEYAQTLGVALDVIKQREGSDVDCNHKYGHAPSN